MTKTPSINAIVEELRAKGELDEEKWKQLRSKNRIIQALILLAALMGSYILVVLKYENMASVMPILAIAVILWQRHNLAYKLACINLSEPVNATIVNGLVTSGRNIFNYLVLKYEFNYNNILYKPKSRNFPMRYGVRIWDKKLALDELPKPPYNVKQLIIFCHPANPKKHIGVILPFDQYTFEYYRLKKVLTLPPSLPTQNSVTHTHDR